MKYAVPSQLKDFPWNNARFPAHKYSPAVCFIQAQFTPLTQSVRFNYLNGIKSQLATYNKYFHTNYTSELDIEISSLFWVLNADLLHTSGDHRPCLQSLAIRITHPNALINHALSISADLFKWSRTNAVVRINYELFIQIWWWPKPVSYRITTIFYISTKWKST